MLNIFPLITTIVALAFSLDQLNQRFDNPFFSQATIGVTIYILYFFWTRYLWKIKLPTLPFLIETLIGLSDVPDISGEWHVSYESSFEDKETGKGKLGEGKITIQQHYTDIKVSGNFGSSSFESFFAVLKEVEGSWYLIYGYTNTSLDKAIREAPNGGMHTGYVNLKITPNIIDGLYTTDWNRKTYGKITLNRP